MKGRNAVLFSSEGGVCRKNRWLHPAFSQGGQGASKYALIAEVPGAPVSR